MSPIARSAVKFTQKIRDATKRTLTLTMIEEATKSNELAHFTSATLKYTYIQTLLVVTTILMVISGTRRTRVIQIRDLT